VGLVRHRDPGGGRPVLPGTRHPDGAAVLGSDAAGVPAGAGPLAPPGGDPRCGVRSRRPGLPPVRRRAARLSGPEAGGAMTSTAPKRPGAPGGDFPPPPGAPGGDLPPPRSAPGGDFPPLPSAPGGDQTVLTVESVDVHAGQTQLLHDVTFSIRRGERVGLIGESGSGKSLTALAVMGLLAEGLHATGDVRLAGQDRNLLTASERR